MRSSRPEPPAQGGDPVAGEAAVGLDLALPRAPGADAAVHPAGAEALEVGPEAPHAGHVVFELGELDLQLALGRVGVVGEDVEDHRGAVDHRHPQRRLEVALLARRQLVVAGDQVGVAGGDLLLQLLQPAAAEVAVGVGLGALLGGLAGGGDAGRAQQLLELGERLPVDLAPVDDADRQRPLAGPRVGDAGAVGRVAALRRAAVSGSIHSIQCRRPAPADRYRVSAMKVFVTGAHGLHRRDRRARSCASAATRSSAWSAAPRKPTALTELGCETVAGDLGDRAAIARRDGGLRRARSTPRRCTRSGIPESQHPAMREANVAGTENVLGAALEAKIAKVVYVSTCGAFGNTHHQIVDESYEHPGEDFTSYYEQTKVEAHQDRQAA